MKKIIISSALIAIMATSAMAQVRVKGHVRQNGTYVQPSVRTAPDSSRMNNYSTKGNTNPYSGNKGYEPMTKPYQAPCYGCK
jgi:hypothetical protein